MPLDDIEPGGDSIVMTWPQDVEVRIRDLDEELSEGEITKKGFWNRKYSLVEEYLSEKQKSSVQSLRCELREGRVSDKDYYDQLATLLIPIKKFMDDGHRVEEDRPDKENVAANSQRSSPKKTAPLGVSSSGSSSLPPADASSSGAGSSSGTGVTGEQKPASRHSGTEEGRAASPRRERSSKSRGQQSIMTMFARQPAKRKTTEEAGESVNKKPKISRCKECLQNMVKTLVIEVADDIEKQNLRLESSCSKEVAIELKDEIANLTNKNVYLTKKLEETKAHSALLVAEVEEANLNSVAVIKKYQNLERQYKELKNEMFQMSKFKARELRKIIEQLVINETNCHICKKEFYNDATRSSHLTGKPHLKKLAEIKRNGKRRLEETQDTGRNIKRRK